MDKQTIHMKSWGGIIGIDKQAMVYCTQYPSFFIHSITTLARYGMEQVPGIYMIPGPLIDMFPEHFVVVVVNGD